MSNDDLNTAFDAAVAASKELPQRPDNATLLRLYALFKQATMGDAATTRPGLTDLVGRAKWDAWNAQKGTPPEEAKRRYIALVHELQQRG